MMKTMVTAALAAVLAMTASAADAATIDFTIRFEALGQGAVRTGDYYTVAGRFDADEVALGSGGIEYRLTGVTGAIAPDGSDQRFGLDSVFAAPSFIGSTPPDYAVYRTGAQPLLSFGVSGDNNFAIWSVGDSATDDGVFSEGGARIVSASLTPLSAVPEPASWALMIGGVGVTGGALRRRRSPGFRPA